MHASTSMSPATTSICRRTSSAGSSSDSFTPSVFCAVTAVIAVIPYTPRIENTFRSAWIPAPPLESDPAIVRAVFVKNVVGIVERPLSGRNRPAHEPGGTRGGPRRCGNADLRPHGPVNT